MSVEPLDYSTPEIYSMISTTINQEWQQHWNYSQGKSTPPYPSAGDKGSGSLIIKTSHGTNTNTNCPTCQIPETLPHILNYCPTYSISRDSSWAYQTKIGASHIPGLPQLREEQQPKSNI
ncbi:hypothetical protein CHS0354_009461 [Potamilus streckersoni]|uniref:Uncharacterized protein n=1 Tax=Potamilus streckersoni TaxID=2493646 RepID=A0AAE0WEF5_9BIVA|nr:hypothetical protein CHS0354_009461 [Potamilus streckersoni]